MHMTQTRFSHCGKRHRENKQVGIASEPIVIIWSIRSSYWRSVNNGVTKRPNNGDAQRMFDWIKSWCSRGAVFSKSRWWRGNWLNSSLTIRNGRRQVPLNYVCIYVRRSCILTSAYLFDFFLYGIKSTLCRLLWKWIKSIRGRYNI